MMQRQFSLLIVCLSLLFAGGCANMNKTVVNNEPATAATRAEQPTTEPASSTITVPGKLVNTIAAVVNDDIITLYEINRDARQAIIEAEKKSTLDDAGRSQIRRAILDRLVEKSAGEPENHGAEY